MNAKYSMLRCPVCREKLKPMTQYAVVCACDTYPVIRDIVYLKKNKAKDNALGYLSRGRIRAATIALLDSRRFLNYLVAFVPHLPLTWLFAIAALCFPSGKAWWRYLANRDRRITHILSLATIGAIQKNDTVVDICCGTGNFLARASLWSRASRCVGIDASFFLLLLARLQYVPLRVLLVCADVNLGLPIHSQTVNRAYLNDCFMYIHQKPMMNELRRILTSRGDAFLTHVHNRGKHNIGQGRGVSPSTLRSSTVTTISDKQLFAHIRNNTNIIYQKVSDSVYDHPSYSYRISSNLTRKPLPIPPQLSVLVKQIPIDFTEDTWLQ
jgi:ubiquinone/menaquinone biosynthesis C-methylase UbiE